MQADIIYPWTQDAVTVALPLNLAERLAKLRQIVCGEMLQIVPLHEDTFNKNRIRLLGEQPATKAY